jgi:hypothetical protein
MASGNRLLSELSAQSDSCKNLDAWAAVGKICSLFFDKEIREDLCSAGGEAKKILHQPATALLIRYQSWVLDCVETLYLLGGSDDPRIDLFLEVTRSLDSDGRDIPAKLHQVLDIFGRQLRILESLVENPPKQIWAIAGEAISREWSLGTVLYVIACVIISLILAPIIGAGIIGLIGIEISVLFGLPVLHQAITGKGVSEENVREVKE